MSNIITTTTTTPTIILVRDNQEAEVIKQYYPEFIQVNRTADIPHMMWYFKRSKDIILTQNEFCKMIRKSRTRGCEYSDYLANYTLRILGNIDLVEPMKISTHDVGFLKNGFCNYNPATHKFIWKNEYSDYPHNGVFGHEKDFAVHGGLYYIKNKLYGVIPPEPFRLFKQILIGSNNYLVFELFDVYGLSYYKTVLSDSLSSIRVKEVTAGESPTYTPPILNPILEQFFSENGVVINEEVFILCDLLHHNLFSNCLHVEKISDKNTIQIIRDFLNTGDNQ